MTSSTNIAIDKTRKIAITLSKSILQKLITSAEAFQEASIFEERLKAILMSKKGVKEKVSIGAVTNLMPLLSTVGLMCLCC